MLKPETINQQSKLAQFSRTGEKQDLILSNPQHVFQYRRLVFNVVLGIMQQAFPIAQKAIGKDSFKALVNEFFKSHNCQTPQVWNLPLEFCNWFKISNQVDLNLPYLSELLYFEWLEIEVHTQKDTSTEVLMPFQGNSTCHLRLNPYFKSIILNYPYHKFAPEEWLNHKGEYPMVIYRGISDFKVHFMAVSKFGFGVLQFLQQTENLTLGEFLEILTQQNNEAQSENLQKQVLTFFNQLSEKGILFEVSK